ncbi:MAG: hypothetical protein ACJ76P_12030 [Actinomycetota bacterium]
MFTDFELEKRFNYHAPDEAKGQRHESVRYQLLAAARYVVANTPEGREQSLAITHLEEAMFWANAAIARWGAV